MAILGPTRVGYVRPCRSKGKMAQDPCGRIFLAAGNGTRRGAPAQALAWLSGLTFCCVIFDNLNFNSDFTLNLLVSPLSLQALLSP